LDDSLKPISKEVGLIIIIQRRNIMKILLEQHLLVQEEFANEDPITIESILGENKGVASMRKITIPKCAIEDLRWVADTFRDSVEQDPQEYDEPQRIIKEFVDPILNSKDGSMYMTDFGVRRLVEEIKACEGKGWVTRKIERAFKEIYFQCGCYKKFVPGTVWSSHSGTHRKKRPDFVKDGVEYEWRGFYEE
jgi:hypothetical protein